MSIIFENNIGVYVSHEKFINKIYEGLTDSSKKTYQINPNLFKIYRMYNRGANNVRVKKKVKDSIRNEFEDQKNEQNEVKSKLTSFLRNIDVEELIEDKALFPDNSLALQTADYIQAECGKYCIVDTNGVNYGHSVIKEINSAKFLFPENSQFFAKDVFEINKHLQGQKFDLILLDPPWWNKYIRRKRKKSTDGYKMMFNEDLKNLPIGNLLSDDGIIAVWCTNSKQNINALLTEIFPRWNVDYTAKWYWVKVTTKAEPICNFAEPPGKQPYEKIMFAHRKRSLPSPEDGKLLISVPSALHSHKPPLNEILETYLPKNSRCLEVFARYLLPNWTSYGNEVLKLQHESMFIQK